MLAIWKVRPEAAAAAVGSAVFVSLASAIGPVIRAMRVVSAMAFREVV
jgi:hypothetical protein